VYLQNGYYPGSFIASSGPQNNKEDEFWEMILLKKCQIVVAIESLVRLDLEFKRLFLFTIFFNRKMHTVMI